MVIILDTIATMLKEPDFWLWFYLTVVVSSTMLPSASDRKAWLPILLSIGVLIGLGFLFGLGAFVMDSLVSPTNNIFRATAVIFAISSGVHLFVLVPTWGIKKLLTKLTGLEIKTA